MRALFLDFDGVLHRAGNGLEETGPHFVWLPLLAEALKGHSDVVVVVHSTWRYQWRVHELRELLVGLESNIVTAAPRGPRRDAIPWFLSMHPGISSYRILDDELKEFGESPPAEVLLCEPGLGLTTPGVIEALRRWLSESLEV